MKKTPKIASFLRAIVAINLAALVDHHYGSLPNLTARQKELAGKAKLSFSTVQRIMKSETGATLDNIESLAGAFELEGYQLLIPALNVTNPQTIKGASRDAKRFQTLWRKEKQLAEVT